MKIKDYLLLFFLILSINQIGISQSDCGTPILTTLECDSLLHNLQSVPASSNNFILINGVTYIPIKVHLVGKTDGTGTLDLNTLNKGLAKINKSYLPQNLQFYFCGTAPNYIYNSTFYNLKNSDASLLTNSNNVTDAINVYFVGSILDDLGVDQGIAGYTSHPTFNNTSNKIVLRNINPWEHELGHYFSLFHTFESNNNTTVSLRETVARTGTGANCSTAGDRLCDTPADPWGLSGATYLSQTCTYTGLITDVNGDKFTPQINNFMSYSFQYCGLPPVFTPNQYSRIGQGLALRLSYTRYNIAGCSPIILTPPSSAVALISGTSASISWTDNSSSETGFIIERSTSSSTGFVAIGGVGPNVTTFIDNTIASGSVYFYRVKASNTANTYSNVAPAVISGCPATLTLTTPISSGSQVFEVSNNIISTSQISGSGTNVIYRAGSQIILNQGFKTGDGSMFKGVISGCSTSARKSMESSINGELEEIELFAYPNPASNGDVTIQYTIPKDGNIGITLASISGINLRNIVEERFHEKGTYSIKISVRDLITGMYLYILQGGNVRIAKKLLVE